MEDETLRDYWYHPWPKNTLNLVHKKTAPKAENNKVLLEGTFCKDYNLENGATKLEFYGFADGIEERGDLNRILRDKLNLHQGNNDQKFRIIIERI